MFTGIIQAIGKVVKSDGKTVWVNASFKQIERGESITVDGVCLTVTRFRGKTLAFDIGKETRRITTLGHLVAGSRVNLERSLRVGDRLGGHYVSGHIEETGRIVKIEKAKQSWRLTLRIPKGVAKYMVSKGSLAVDGISLTVAAMRKGFIQIMIIPHTLSHTTLGKKMVGDRVNLEPDMLAKYVLGRKSL